MVNAMLVHAFCDRRHLRRLFHLHNQVINRPILGFPSLSLRFLGTTGIDCDADELACTFVRIPEDREASPQSVAASFTGIDFRLKAEKQTMI